MTLYHLEGDTHPLPHDIPSFTTVEPQSYGLTSFPDGVSTIINC